MGIKKEIEATTGILSESSPVKSTHITALEDYL